jgi:sigma-E factor negative regulatory protein RseA
MQEQLNEKISLLVDDQLDEQQALGLLKTIKNDAVLQSKLQRYNLISQALKSEQCLVADKAFAEKIHQQLRDEPVYFIPRKQIVVSWQKRGLALAASVVLAMVWIFGSIEKQANPIAGINTVAKHSIQPNQMNAQFKEYLQAHDNVWYVNNNVGGQAYARLAGYQQK